MVRNRRMNMTMKGRKDRRMKERRMKEKGIGKKMKWAAAAMAFTLVGANVAGMAATPMVYLRAADTTHSIIDGNSQAGSLLITRKSKSADGTADTPLAGAKYSIYKILSITPGSTPGEFAKFEKVSVFSEVLSGVTPDALYGTYSAAELDALAIDLENAAKSQTPDATGTTAAATGSYRFENLDLGYYLVVETKAPDGYVAGKPFLVSVPSTDNYLTGAAGTEWLYDVEVTPKSAEISIDKNLAEGEDGSVKEGDYVQYVIETTIPEYTEDYATPKFIIKDVMSDGLEIQNDTAHPVNVQLDGTSVTAAENTFSIIAANKTGEEEDIQISFQPDYIRQNLGKSVQVTYFAKVGEKAVMGNSGNPNRAFLEYHNKPDTDARAESAEVKVYSFGIEVEKFAKPGTALADATFELYSDADLTEEHKVGTLVSNEEGLLNFNRLDKGIYYLKETKSPAGYTLLANPIKIEITADEIGNLASGTFTLKVNDKEITASEGRFVTRFDVATGVSTVAVENQRGFFLPATGGMGIALFLGIGAAGMMMLTIVVVIKAKKGDFFK